jgi:hypothetical protein
MLCGADKKPATTTGGAIHGPEPLALAVRSPSVNADQATVVAGFAAGIAFPVSVAALVVALLSWRATKRQADVMTRQDHRARTPLIDVVRVKGERAYMRVLLALVNRDGADLDDCRIELLDPAPGGGTVTPGFEVTPGESMVATLKIGRLPAHLPVTLAEPLIVRPEHYGRLVTFRLALRRGDEVWDDVIVSLKLPPDPTRSVVARFG